MKPKITDFGMARIFSKDGLEAKTGRIVGTYGDVPPEYVKQDIYSANRMSTALEFSFYNS